MPISARTISSRTQRRCLLLLALVATLVLPLLTSCGGKQEDDVYVPPPGTLFIQVETSTGAAVADAAVNTEPFVGGGVSDPSGALFLADVPPGYYRVSAIHDALGAASKPVEVLTGELLEVTLTLDDGSSGSGGGGGTGGTGGTSGGRGGTGGSGGSLGGTGGSGGSLGGTGGSGGVVIDLDYIDVATQVEAMVVDPARPYLYALDRVNNSFLFVNLETRTVEKTIFVGSNPVDADFDDTGNQMFVANFGSTEIAIVDLETQEIARTIFVDPSLGTWEGNPYRIAVTAGNTLVFTSEDQWCDLKLVNATNGGHITGTGSLYSPDLVASADGTRLYVGESGGALHRFEVGEATLTEVDATVDGGSRNVVLSGDEEFVFYGGSKIRASNLKNVLGSFNDEIYASNTDGSRVVSSSKVFDGNTFAILGLLPLTTSTLALHPDGHTLYLYDIGLSRVYIFDVGDI